MIPFVWHSQKDKTMVSSLRTGHWLPEDRSRMSLLLFRINTKELFGGGNRTVLCLDCGGDSLHVLRVIELTDFFP